MPAARVLARLAYDDDAGHHSFDIVKDSVTIGRGGITYPVDIKIVSSADVSREHARIRHDVQTGRLFLIDLSSLGTTLNGRHVPRGYDEANGTKRENGVETPLPNQARIGLADMVYLQFELGARSALLGRYLLLTHGPAEAGQLRNATSGYRRCTRSPRLVGPTPVSSAR